MNVRAWIPVVFAVLLPLAALCALFGSYFAWKFFAIYLPNKRSVDECLPSGGTCSIDGVANLELSGGMMALFFGIALALLVAAFTSVRCRAMVGAAMTHAGHSDLDQTQP